MRLNARITSSKTTALLLDRGSATVPHTELEGIGVLRLRESQNVESLTLFCLGFYIMYIFYKKLLLVDGDLTFITLRF